MGKPLFVFIMECETDIGTPWGLKMISYSAVPNPSKLGNGMWQTETL